MSDADPLRILHVTDLHLVADPDGDLYGVRTNASFEAVMKRALGDAAWTPDAVLVTGDLAEDATTEVYQRFHTRVDPLGIPVLCLPGNHDDPAEMGRVLNRGNVSLCASRSIGRWKFVMLDSFLPGEAGGTVSAAEIRRLNAELASSRDRWVVVAVHQQPLPMGSAWLDGVGLTNGPELLATLARHENVRALVWGHVHQASDRRHGAVRLLSTPSTCAQFAPHTERCVMDIRPPGFRRLELHASGDVGTEVHWLEDWAPANRPTDSRASHGRKIGI